VEDRNAYVSVEVDIGVPHGGDELHLWRAVRVRLGEDQFTVEDASLAARCCLWLAGAVQDVDGPVDGQHSDGDNEMKSWGRERGRAREGGALESLRRAGQTNVPFVEIGLVGETSGEEFWWSLAELCRRGREKGQTDACGVQSLRRGE
jgi:hypothetical protein